MIADTMGRIMSGKDVFVGDQATRKWTYNITDYALGGAAILSSPDRVIDDVTGYSSFADHSIFLNRYNETTFESMPDDWQQNYLQSQVSDILRLPIIHLSGSQIETIYYGFENGSFSYVGVESVDFFSPGILK